MKPDNDPDNNKATDEPSYAPEEHGLGTGIGAGGGALTGALMGASLGPLGSVTGAILGGAFGAVAGRAIAAGIDPEAEDAYWHERFNKEPYYESGYAFEDYSPAYRLGWQLYSPQTTFESAEKILSDEWAKGRGGSKLDWHQARDAAKAGWTRMESLHPRKYQQDLKNP